MTLLIPFFIGYFNPDNALDNKQSFCPLKMLTGFPCPSCGITKSLVYTYEGNFLKAFHYHIYGPLVIFFCFFIIILFSIELKTKEKYLSRFFYSKKLAYFFAITLFFYHLCRLFYFVKEHTWAEIVSESIWK